MSVGLLETRKGHHVYGHSRDRLCYKSFHCREKKTRKLQLTNSWTAIDRLSIIWKSDLLYRCTTWMLTKRLGKKLDGNYTRMLRAILNKSWRQHLTRHQLYAHQSPIMKTIQARRTRHAGRCWRSRNEIISGVLLWTPHMAGQKQGEQLEHTYSSYVRIRDVALKTCQRRWTIGRCGERGSGISVLAVRHNDDDMLQERCDLLPSRWSKRTTSSVSTTRW